MKRIIFILLLIPFFTNGQNVGTLPNSVLPIDTSSYTLVAQPSATTLRKLSLNRIYNAMPFASGSVNGRLSSTDWNTFNGKVGTTRALTIAGTSGRITSSAGSQSLAADRTWTLDLATAGTAGTYTSVTTDAYGRVTSGTNPEFFLRGGNAFGGTSVLGLTDNFNLTLQTGNANLLLNTNATNRLTINNSGQWTTSVSVPAGTGTGYDFAPTLNGTGSNTLVGLNVNATFSGTLTSSTLNIFRLQNAGSNVFQFTRDGQINFGSQTAAGWIGVTTDAGSADAAGRTMNWRGTGNFQSSSTVSHLISLRQANINTASLTGLRISSPSGDETVQATLGSNSYTLVSLVPSINMTGGTTTFTAWDYNPNVIASVGLTHIAANLRVGEMRLGQIVQNDALTQFLVRDNSTGAVRFRDVATIYTDEQAQDAVGAMIDGSLTYVDGTPLLQRAALTGDVAASAGSNSTTIANDAVTFAKFQNITDARLLGRSAGSSGDMQEITIGAGLTLSGGSLSASGGGGTYYAPTTLVANSTDANFTATVNGVHNILDGVASANRVITIPTGSDGDVMKFYNTEDFYVWSFTGATVYLADRTTVVTELLYNVPCFMEKIDGRWIITN
jgi:hypothetical protein